MQIRELSVPDSYEITPRAFEDDRGVFLEWYRADVLSEWLGRPALELRQANTSVSGRGVLRGIHFADVPRGQAKYVTALYGAVLDFVVDIRVGSPTFGRWDSVLLDDADRRAVFLSEGLGHAFIALTEGAVVSYLVSDVYRPDREHGVDPLDPAIGLDLPAAAGTPRLSEKDAAAPGLEAAREAGTLPEWSAMRRFYDDQGSTEGAS